MKNKDNILEKYKTNYKRTIKKMKISEYPNIKFSLLDWFFNVKI